MKKMEVEILINANQEKVWDSVVNPEKYKAWTKVFHEGSYFEGNWKQGEKILFLAISEEGKKEGMVSEIAESRYPEYISIRHLGMISDGIEDTSSDEVRKWAPSYENYTFIREGKDQTKFKMDMNIDEEYYDMFMEIWPKALKLLKEVSEK
ncbi:MAG: hypothetical protein DWQ44_09520 [Bacteroidetes bacterium]|nr:MAG: hypothetical protein DWQ33_09795 [Bacteroidota bacterium]REK06522.1 MAG: hypothetical protein DWQ39_03310 [Bacteroidota bacterium]REK33288.1 MAG: hypothetical protein DWQ44_09520 [Bacteroidota bacterium]REK49688.1 MAG: hypothetical protein DWQ48_06075 [Bacteroidota bacterium]